MSRCFPFPPPGYEARLRSEDKDLLKKEKRKEKKHKKDKHREKRERKEKNRDHRKDKRNKKHKREKRREKRKNRDRDKDKSQTLEQETQKNYDLGNRKPGERVQNEAVKHIKPTDELVTQIFGHASHKCNNARELLHGSTDSIGATGSKEKEWNSLSRMVKKSAQATQDNHGMVQKSDSIPHANKKGMRRGVDSKTRIKNGKSLQVGSPEKHSSRKPNCNGVDLPQDNSDTQRRSEGGHITSTVVSAAGRQANGRITPSPDTLQIAEEMGQYPEISAHSANGKSDRISTKGMMGKENQSANNCHGKMDQQFVRSKDGAVEGKAKTEELRTNYCKGVKGKDRDLGVKKRKTEYKTKQKEMKKNGNVNEQKHEDLGALGASKNKVDDLMHLACLNEQKFGSDDIKKRKGLDANRSPHQHSMRTAKLPRMSPTNLTCMDEEILQRSQGITTYSATELVGTNTCNIDQHKPQGSYNITGPHYSEEHIASVSPSGYESNKGYLKQPHPDTKYLSQVHSIPSTEDFPEYIDQDWLFPEDHVEWKTAKSEAAESCQVWSDAQLIDTAGVVALPYVVPL
ncbi:uncharacterized protein LOC133895316 isoform X2 [Phragmites australis]|uniref:uncharacterized protein LOC133895316 isoform X2 n=1 Tax=Phragmites australis TaxID=29695 RepID=UPI002D788625|nr:uncharacterized protein LOC133895316 isoform X2 [Phragmites australis]